MHTKDIFFNLIFIIRKKVKNNNWQDQFNYFYIKLIVLNSLLKKYYKFINDKNINNLIIASLLSNQCRTYKC